MRLNDEYTVDISQLLPLMVVTIEFYGVADVCAEAQPPKAYNSPTDKPRRRAHVSCSYFEIVILAQREER